MQKLSFCGENYFMIVNKNKVFVATLFHFASIFANIAYWSRFFPKFFPYIGYCVCQCRKIAFAQTPQWIYTFFLIFPFLFSNCAKIQSFFPVQMFCSMFIVFISFLLISFMVLPIFPAFHPFCKRKNQEKRFFSSSCSYSSSNQKKKKFLQWLRAVSWRKKRRKINMKLFRCVFSACLHVRSLYYFWCDAIDLFSRFATNTSK